MYRRRPRGLPENHSHHHSGFLLLTRIPKMVEADVPAVAEDGLKEQNGLIDEPANVRGSVIRRNLDWQAQFAGKLCHTDYTWT